MLSSISMRRAGAILGVLGLAALAACSRPPQQLVVYSARNEQLIKPIFDRYTAETGMPVRFVTDEAADFHLQLLDTPDSADVVLVDEDAAQPCSAIPTQTIRVDAAGTSPWTADVTVHLSSAPDAHKLYVRSAAFTRQEAAALIAVLWRQQHGTHRQALAQRH